MQGARDSRDMIVTLTRPPTPSRKILSEHLGTVKKADKCSQEDINSKPTIQNNGEIQFPINLKTFRKLIFP